MEWADIVSHGPAWTVAIGFLATLIRVARQMAWDHASFLAQLQLHLKQQNELLGKNNTLLVSLDNKLAAAVVCRPPGKEQHESVVSCMPVGGVAIPAGG